MTNLVIQIFYIITLFCCIYKSYLEIITKERKLIKKKLTFKVINNIIFLTREIKRKIKEVKYGGFY